MTSTTTETTAVEYEKGSWQYDLYRSVKMTDKSTEMKKRASALLWKGARTAAERWLDESDNDPQAEGLQSDLLEVMGNSRKGDVSKIKTVALAVKENGLVLDSYPNLSQAYAAASRLRVTEKEERAEDGVLAKAVESLAEQASTVSTGTTPEQAVAIIFAKGEDEAARLIGDALGSDDARRAWVRAVAADATGRVAEAKAKAKAEADAKKAAEKEAKDKAKAEQAEAKAKAQAEKPTAKKAEAKAKPAAVAKKAATPKATAKPVAKPVAKA